MIVDFGSGKRIQTITYNLQLNSIIIKVFSGLAVLFQAADPIEPVLDPSKAFNYVGNNNKQLSRISNKPKKF